MSVIFNYLNNFYFPKKLEFNNQLFEIFLNANPILFNEDCLLEETKTLKNLPQIYHNDFKTRFLLINQIWEYLLIESKPTIWNKLSHNENIDFSLYNGSLSLDEMNQIWKNQQFKDINNLYAKINIKSKEIQISEFINFMGSLDKQTWMLIIQLIDNLFEFNYTPQLINDESSDLSRNDQPDSNLEVESQSNSNLDSEFILEDKKEKELTNNQKKKFNLTKNIKEALSYIKRFFLLLLK